jgi:hypothetical protein
MKIGRGRFASLCLMGLLSLFLLAACSSTASSTPAVSNVSPTATLSQVSPTSTVSNVNSVFATFAGTWISHDDQLIFAVNGTGVENWNAGPCTGGISGLCSGIGDLTFAANADGSLTGTYQSVSYETSSGPVPPSYQPLSGYPVVGNTMSLKHNGAGLLAAMVNGNSWNYCDPAAPLSETQGKCGA